MASGSPSPHKPACSICSRRKVKCDKGDPCSNCLKSQSQCVYEAPALHRRPRKRAADDDLLSRLAAYEDLMRKNNVDFAPLAHTWIPSKLEAQVDEPEPIRFVPLTPALTSPGSTVVGSENIGNLPGDTERHVHTVMTRQLKYPPIYGVCHKDDPILTPMPSLHQMFSAKNVSPSQSHPEPQHIYRLWQTFVDNVNPLFKIVHIPTLQQRVLDASWNPSSAPKPLQATMLAIYALSVTSMSPEACQKAFNESRVALMTRYRTAAFQALVEVDFLTTKDFEVVQAFVLFLFINPESELTATLTAAAVKLCRSLGVHHAKPDTKLSFFEREMRIRVWWQLYGLEARTRALGSPDSRCPPSRGEFGDVRSPLNVNDADLHPDMTEPPIEHSRSTEMMCVLMKYEVFNWIRSTPAASLVFEHIAQSRAKDKTMIEVETKAINEIESIYYNKYLKDIDKRIPIHAQTFNMAKLVIARMRFKVYHPRCRRTVNGDDVAMSREENDMLFELAMSWVEAAETGLRSMFSAHIFTHMTSKCHIDAYIYIISELRYRCTGDRVKKAWQSIEILYEEYPEMLESKSTFFEALRDLTFEAWEARHRAVAASHGLGEAEAIPRFIQILQDKAKEKMEAEAQVSMAPNLQNLDSLGLTDDGNLDWDYWNNFLSL
ncbi:C6 transcription factor [Colletotrichum kahawae]|uniref:C6 transcription factor n=1 Tax=Colletotrichum kahawae TaxID=34407 RepID=A0AAD9Y9E9_COLKA|nr:C6 transcription factor [Colletotrichum kahawae]